MKVLSNWRSVRLWESRLEQDLHRRHSMRAHGLLIGTFTLLLMWCTSALVMRFGTQSLAVRYLFTLGVGYIAYLLILRWWAQRLAQGRQVDIDGADALPDVLPDTAGGRVQGSSSSVDLGDVADIVDGGSAIADVAGDIAGGAFEAIGSADEGAIVVVPVIAIFLIGCAIVFGAGWLVLLYFGSDVLMAVTLEVAFSYVSARAAVRLAREGWLSAALRLTWKPLLGAVVCAVVLGASIDHFMPGVHSLPAAVRAIFGR